MCNEEFHLKDEFGEGSGERDEILRGRKSMNKRCLSGGSGREQ